MVNNQHIKRNLTLFGFFSLTASMVLTVYEYPTFATSKLHLIFFLILEGLFWFIPVALCAAEMATVNGWNNSGGGIFSWVSHTLGKRWGICSYFLPMVSNYCWICDNDLLYFRCIFICT